MSPMGIGRSAHFVFLLPVCLQVSVVDTYSGLSRDKGLAAFRARGPPLKIVGDAERGASLPLPQWSHS